MDFLRIWIDSYVVDFKSNVLEYLKVEIYKCFVGICINFYFASESWNKSYIPLSNLFYLTLGSLEFFCYSLLVLHRFCTQITNTIYFENFENPFFNTNISFQEEPKFSHFVKEGAKELAFSTTF